MSTRVEPLARRQTLAQEIISEARFAIEPLAPERPQERELAAMRGAPLRR